LRFTDKITVEQRAKIFESGIYFSGGGSYFHAICKRMASPLKLPYHIGTAPELDVINGIREIIKDTQKFKAYIFK
jgi:actin-like ATPase involved in cell morphogenesis